MSDFEHFGTCPVCHKRMCIDDGGCCTPEPKVDYCEGCGEDLEATGHKCVECGDDISEKQCEGSKGLCPQCVWLLDK